MELASIHGPTGSLEAITWDWDPASTSQPDVTIWTKFRRMPDGSLLMIEAVQLPPSGGVPELPVSILDTKPIGLPSNSDANS